MKYIIPSVNLSKLEKKINRAINKGAPIQFTKGNEVYVQDPKYPSVTHKAVEIFVDGFYKINGWEFLATLEHKTAGNIIRSINSDIAIPEYYRTCEPRCEHCGVSRYRKDTYIIYNKEEDRFMQVGKTCFKDFTDGLDPKICAEIASIIEECEEAQNYETDAEFYAMIKGNSISSYFNTKEILRYIISLVKDHGYDKETSRDIILDNIGGSSPKIELEECSEELLNEILSWINNLNDRSDYNYSCKLLANSDYIESRDFNYLLSCVNQYFKEQVISKESNSSYVGNIGDKIDIEIANYRVLFENHYRVSYYVYANAFTYELVDIKGNIYVLKTSKKLDLIDDLEHIIPIKIRATVDAHTEYKGVKQTHIKRFKLLDYKTIK